MEIIIIYLLILIVPAVASYNIRKTYGRYKGVPNTSKLSGCEVARRILDEHGLTNVYVVENPNGELSDCYDPQRKTVRLSTDVYHGETVAALAVAAHECGHAIQDKEGYAMMKIRSLIYPVVSIGTKLAYILLFIGFIAQILDLIYLAIGLTSLGLIFELITLPVEFDASNRAKKILLEDGITSVDENGGVSKVLGAAAFTYVAAVLTTLLQMAYYLLRAMDRR